MLIGDWGAEASNYAEVQAAIAKKMQSYYQKQKSDGYNLLFIAAVGDNFYYHGQDCSEWTAKWKDMYGELADGVPWLAVYGNHDWGNSDADCMCSWTKPRYVDPTTNMPYACNQINSNKKGCNPANYYLPDFGYYYRIDQLEFELLVVEESYTDCPDGIGGTGPDSGASEVFKNCGSTSVGCGWMHKLQNATESMLQQRARVSTNSNFLIIQHYPGRGSALLNMFHNNRGKNVNASNDRVVAAYGHKHLQACDGVNSKTGLCDLIQNGGGGGCCNEDTLRGFYTMSFDNNKRLIQPLAYNDAQLSCKYPCGAGSSAEEFNTPELVFETCCNTINPDVDCSMWDLTTCPV
jgi:hypothetical protein